MNATSLLVLAIAGLLVSTVSAAGALLLHEIAWHRLEAYCRRRKKMKWFHDIHENRHELVLGAQSLQMLGIALAGTCGLAWLPAFRLGQPVSTATLAGATALAALILLASNSWIPRAVQRVAAPGFLYRTWRLWWAVAWLLRPLRAGVEAVSALFQRATGTAHQGDQEEAFEDEIRAMVSEGEHEGLLESDAREMIEAVIQLDDNIVFEVMMPRSKVDALEVGVGWDAMIDFVVRCGRTRIPVYDGQFERAEDVIGVLFAKDLIQEAAKPPEQRRPLRKLVRKPLVVPQSTLLDEMLKQFLNHRTHMAIVLDEYHLIAGVVTIEDILEEIVGEIIDETDREEPGPIQRVSPDRVEAEGRVRLEELNDLLGLQLPTESDFDTLAGYLMTRLARVPQSGETLVLDHVQFDVLKATSRTVERVGLTLLHPEGGDQAQTPVSLRAKPA